MTENERMKLVESTRGVGVLSWRGERFDAVPYVLERFQAMTTGGLPVPGLHRIEGRLDIGAMAAASGIAGGSVALELEDGRKLNLTVTDSSGNVLAEGHGPSKCSCC